MPTRKKPQAPKVIPDKIPQELKDHRRWVAWQYRGHKGSWKKLPINCRTGGRADITNPAVLVGFDEALAYYQQKRLDGVGFAFLADDPYSGIDLDDVRQPETGEFEPRAREILRAVNSYSELSPSGTGAKVLVRGKLPPGSRSRKGNIELYSKDRYFTVTGLHLAGTPTGIEQRDEALARLYDQVFCGVQAPPVVPNSESSVKRDTATVLAKAMRAADGDRFARLWQGDTSGYRSVSEADLALASLLAFWVGPDPSEIERHFGLSALGKREKWADRKDYRDSTIAKALKGRTDYYPWEPGLLPRAPRTIQTIQTIQDHTGLSNTGCLPAGREGALTPGEIEQAKQLAVDLAADTHADLPNYRTSFLLARRLRRVSVQAFPEQFEGAVAVYAECAGRPFYELWYAFLECWHRVRFAEGDDPLAWAADLAKQNPLPTDPRLGPPYQFVVSVAFYLSELTQPQPFLLPCQRLAVLLNTSKMTVSRIIKLMKRNGVVQEVAAHRFTEGKAKEFLYVGGQPIAVPQAA